MRKCLLLASMLVFSLSFCQNSTITLGKTPNKMFLVNGESFKYSEYHEVFKNELALNYIKRAKSNKTAATIFGFAGGFGLGFGIVGALTNNKSKLVFDANGGAHIEKNNTGWLIAGIGAGLIGVSIPFAIGERRNLLKAVDAENATKGKVTYFQFQTTGNSVSLCYNF